MKACLQLYKRFSEFWHKVRPLTFKRVTCSPAPFRLDFSFLIYLLFANVYYQTLLQAVAFLNCSFKQLKKKTKTEKKMLIPSLRGEA